MASAEPTQTAVDTSVLVAALTAWHHQHESARDLLDEVLRSRRVLISSRVLVETYSVLTRMPASFRLSAKDAFDLLSGTLEGRVEIVDLPAERTWQFLEGQAGRGVAGGSVYDAEIAEATAQGGARRILTFNRRHFSRVAPADLEVVVPGEV